jgi:hypothetical protein
MSHFLQNSTQNLNIFRINQIEGENDLFNIKREY